MVIPVYCTMFKTYYSGSTSVGSGLLLLCLSVRTVGGPKRDLLEGKMVCSVGMLL